MDLAEKYNLIYHIHLSETKFEVEQIKEKYGATPIKHLDNLGLLKENVLAAHVVHPTDEEIDLMAKKGVKISHCPESNLKLASGIAPVPKMLETGICISVGTDGTASNDDLDIIGEISTSAKIHKGYNLNPTVVNAKEALLMATREGAKAINKFEEIGSLEIGKKADITLIDISQPHLNPLFDPYTQIVYSSKGLDVDTVIINGDIKVLNKEVLVLDKSYLLEKAILWKNRILENIKN